MGYNFNEIYYRKNTNCVKYDTIKNVFGNEDIIPMWVADMDFKTPDFIMEAIRQRTNHEVLGYTVRGDSFYQSIINWIQKRHGWKVEKDWIAFSPGVVPALSMLILAFTKPGDKIIVQPPVYFPFFFTALNNGRQLIYNQLIEDKNHYSFNFDDLKKQIDLRTKMLLLSNPHNPVARVWRKEELEELVTICLNNDILMISDEIHSDIVFPRYKHIPLATISETVAENTIAAYAPSKTFNLAGLSTSYLIIPNKKHKATYENFLFDLHVGNGNIFGNVALEAAYQYGAEWLDELISYLEKNVDILKAFVAKHQDKVELTEPEATYLMWLNFKRIGMDDVDLKSFIINKANLGLNAGTQFGIGGQGFQRMNIACPQSTLTRALEQLEKAFEIL